MNAIQTLKKDSFCEAVINALSVKDSSGIEITKLVPIGNWALKDNHLMECFAKWRQTFMRFFLTNFTASVTSTKGYLSNYSISQANRIMFAIYIGDDLVGHMGLSNVENKKAELDNIIRGKSGGHKDLMYFAEKALLCWAFEVLLVDRVDAQVMSKNFLALSLHERFGFLLKDRFPLKKVLSDDSFSFEKCTKEESTEKFYLDVIQVTKKQFAESILSI